MLAEKPRANKSDYQDGAKWANHNYAAFHERAVCFHAACAGRYRSMPATNSGMLIGLARNGCPWICRPDLASAFVTRAVRKTTGVLSNVGSDSIYLELSYPGLIRRFLESTQYSAKIQ